MGNLRFDRKVRQLLQFAKQSRLQREPLQQQQVNSRRFRGMKEMQRQKLIDGTRFQAHSSSSENLENRCFGPANVYKEDCGREPSLDDLTDQHALRDPVLEDRHNIRLENG